MGPRERPKEGTTPVVERPTSAAGSHPLPRLFGAGLPPRTQEQRYAGLGWRERPLSNTALEPRSGRLAGFPQRGGRSSTRATTLCWLALCRLALPVRLRLSWVRPGHRVDGALSRRAHPRASGLRAGEPVPGRSCDPRRPIAATRDLAGGRLGHAERRSCAQRDSPSEIGDSGDMIVTERAGLCSELSKVIFTLQ